MSPNTNGQGAASLLFESPTIDPDLEENVVNTIRMLALDAVQAANSGHAGLPMGMATAALTLWRRHLRYNPANPEWHNRDRFILSAGHGSMLLYSLLHLTGYDLPLQELKNFRQYGSMTPGHPEYGHAPGVETTTGPLGQGFANGVGMAIAEQWLAANFNRPGHDVISHHVYAIVSDGDLMEGVAQEAASLAGHLGLGKLIYLYDDNRVTIDGYTDLAFTEDQYQRFEAYGWHVLKVDGMDGAAVDAAIAAAKQDPRPSLIGCTTVIGFGAPKQGEPDMHSDALPDDEVAQTKANLEWPQEPAFYLPEEVRDFCLQAVARGKRLESDDSALWDAYAAAHPDLAAQLSAMLQGQLPEGWEDVLPTFDPGGSQATRNASALENRGGPTALILSRQNLPVFDRTAVQIGAADRAAKGGYVFFDGATNPESPALVFISSGSELELAYAAAQQLAESGAAVRVVSLPSWELFAAQSAEYRREVLPPDALKVSVEAGVVQGWERWVGNDPARGAAIGLDRFGASAPQQDVYANLGLTVEAVVRAAQALLET